MTILSSSQVAPLLHIDLCLHCNLYTLGGLDPQTGRCLTCQEQPRYTAMDLTNPVYMQTDAQRASMRTRRCRHGHEKQQSGRGWVCQTCNREAQARRKARLQEEARKAG